MSTARVFNVMPLNPRVRVDGDDLVIEFDDATPRAEPVIKTATGADLEPARTASQDLGRWRFDTERLEFPQQVAREVRDTWPGTTVTYNPMALTMNATIRANGVEVAVRMSFDRGEFWLRFDAHPSGAHFGERAVWTPNHVVSAIRDALEGVRNRGYGEASPPSEPNPSWPTLWRDLRIDPPKPGRTLLVRLLENPRSRRATMDPAGNLLYRNDRVVLWRYERCPWDD